MKINNFNGIICHHRIKTKPSEWVDIYSWDPFIGSQPNLSFVLCTHAIFGWHAFQWSHPHTHSVLSKNAYLPSYQIICGTCAPCLSHLSDNTFMFCWRIMSDLLSFCHSTTYIFVIHSSLQYNHLSYIFNLFQNTLRLEAMKSYHWVRSSRTILPASSILGRRERKDMTLQENWLSNSCKCWNTRIHG